MRLLVCMITYERLAYTQKTMKNFISSIDVPYYLVVVDNNSTDGTQKWLEEEGMQDKLILNPKNYYPGKACNIGWAEGLEEFNATHLMRLDNDMKFKPKWSLKAEEYFDKMPPLGQLGLDNGALDSYEDDERYLTTIDGKTINAWPGNIGGPCIIRREIWDRGARYDETPWEDLKTVMITPQEDVKFSLSMHRYGYLYGHPSEKLAETFATPDKWFKYPDYYKKTLTERGYDANSISG